MKRITSFLRMIAVSRIPSSRRIEIAIDVNATLDSRIGKMTTAEMVSASGLIRSADA